MKKIIGIAVIAFLIIFLNLHVSAEEQARESDVGIDEKLGGFIPLKLSFYDENRKPVTLKEFAGKPLIILLVYFHCADVCNPLLNGVVDVLDRLDAEPGKDYSVLTVSFDENDSPEIANQKKKDFLSSFTKKRFPQEEWKFLTGDSANIKKLTDAVGFKFKRAERGFLHPASPLIVLSSEGKIVRYLYGIKFLPFDLKMALTEASEGRVGRTIGKVLLFCYSYDPEGRRYALDILKIAGIGIIIFVIVIIVFLNRKVKG